MQYLVFCCRNVLITTKMAVGFVLCLCVRFCCLFIHWARSRWLSQNLCVEMTLGYFTERMQTSTYILPDPQVIGSQYTCHTQPQLFDDRSFAGDPETLPLFSVALLFFLHPTHFIPPRKREKVSPFILRSVSIVCRTLIFCSGDFV